MKENVETFEARGTAKQKTDTELITAFQNGDILGFNELVRRYQERVYWIARRMVLDHDDADDITQDVFVKVYGALNKFRMESEFFTWVYRITVNISLNKIRAKKMKRFFRLDDDNALPQDVELSDDANHPDVLLQKQELKNAIENAVKKLPKQQRAVFVMRFYDELSYEEISQLLKRSIGGLKANYFHAIKKIQHYVQHALQ